MSWIWKTKTMGWIEQKLINLTTTIYLKRREPEPTIMPLGAEPTPTKPRKATKPVSKVKAKPKAKPTPKTTARSKRRKV